MRSCARPAPCATPPDAPGRPAKRSSGQRPPIPGEPPGNGLKNRPNGPCPCGSGLRFKRCCLNRAQQPA
ncbi:MAG: SEC-C metal-binding domain-containing protein [Candidatus Eremiobacterota bacterium]